MSKIVLVLPIAVLSFLLISATANARDSLQEAADMAEVFVYGQQSKNEALLREISDPEQYEAMEEMRSQDKGNPNENVRVNDVEITEINGDRALAKATYSKKHSKGETQTDVHLQRVDGQWQVTTPPNTESE
jgi:DNA-binding protein H-NS